MYEAFYGLKEKPFSLTPDPKYLFLSDKHKEAFAHLMYGIKNGNGFVMVTGEIGTGKTTLSRNLVQQLDENTELAFIFNPPLSPLELMKKINAEFGVDASSDHVLDLVEALNGYLLEANAKDKNCVLVIDEAQTLTPQVLEQVRLLSNLETETQKLLQIVLIGQPELSEMLGLRELRQLNQRITARYHLHPLSEKETLQYIAYRLHVAGGRRKVKFSKSAVHVIFRHSAGTPRVINALCDRALLIGYTKEARVITARVVRQAAREIFGEKATLGGYRRPLWTRLPRPATVAGLVIVIAAVGVFIGYRAGLSWSKSPDVAADPAAPRPLEIAKAPAPAAVESPPAATVTAPQPAPQPQPQPQPVRQPDPPPATPTAPAPAEEAAAPQAAKPLEELLAASTYPAVASAATAALFGAWGVDSDIPPQEWSTARVVMEAVANGLAIEQLAPALEQLLAINFPALVRLRTDDQIYWVALLGRTDANLRIALAPGDAAEVPRESFARLYDGSAIIPWRDLAPGTPVLSLGDSGPPVLTLKKSLRQLGRLTANNTNNRYDSETASAVARIQAETGLLVDSIAGQQVRMVMTSWLPQRSTPVLSAQSSPAPEIVETPPAQIAEPRPATMAPPQEAPAAIAETAAPDPETTEVQEEAAPSEIEGADIEDAEPEITAETEPPAATPAEEEAPARPAGLAALLEEGPPERPLPPESPERTDLDGDPVEVQELPKP